MENAESDEPEKKRPHLNSLSSPMARHSSASPDNRPFSGIRIRNSFSSWLDVQKHELQDLEAKIKELKDKQLVDDLVLLGVRAGAPQTSLQTLDRVDHSRGFIPSCHAEEMFLCRLLETDSVESIENDGSLQNIKAALDKHTSSTRALMKFLEDIINAQRPIIESIALALQGNLSAEVV